ACEIAHVSDRRVPPERDVELAAAVEPAEAVVTGPVQKIEERRRVARPVAPRPDELVEPLAMPVEQRAIVLHRQVARESPFDPPIEIDEVWVRVIEERALRGEAQGHRQPA